MASGGAEEDDGGIPLDIDNVHMLLQVEHEQIQKRTFTNWINAQLAKRCPPSCMADLFSDIRDGSQLLDLLEVMSGQPMKRQRGRGVFQHRANIETALNFLKKKSIKLVNINIPDIIDGRPSIILGLVWTIILHCHIEELASTLAYNSCHSSLDSLASLDSFPGSPIPASPVPAGRTSPLHRRFQVSAKKALLMWVRDQCKKVGCSMSVKNFKSSWRSGEAFLAILCSLRPQLADLSLVQSRSNQENLEEAFHLAERELHIPRLLEPQDVDVEDPDEKSIMTYVAQFLQYSNDMPAPDDHLQLFPLVQPFSLSPVNLPAHFTPAIAVSPLRQVSPSERALEVTCWLQQAFEELSEAWTATEKSNFAEKYHVFQNVAGSFTEQRKPVMTLLAAIRRCPELSQEQCALRTAWDRLEEKLQRCKADLDSSLPPPLNSVVTWLQRAEAALTEEGGRVGDHADAAKEARAQQDVQKSLMREMSHHVKILDTFLNMDDSGNEVVPPEKFDEIKRRLTNIRVTAKYQGIKLEYRECRHTVLDLLGRISAKLQTWKAPYSSQETVLLLLQDWHETVDRQSLLLILMDALQNLKEKANAYNSKAALGNDSQLVTRQVKEAESEAELATQVVTAVRGTMERVLSAWETYDKCLTALQTWLAQEIQSSTQSPAAGTKDMSEFTSCQAKLNEAGNFLIEMTEPSTSLALAEHLSRVNMQWAECMKRTVFGVSSEPSVSPMCLQMVHSLTQEASWLLRQPLEVASVSLKANRQKLQLLSKRMAEVDLSSLSPSPDSQTAHMENLQQTLPQMVVEAERTCGELQQAASRLEGCLAELDHWSTDAQDCYQHLKEEKHRGRSLLEPTAKALISRGMQLENQVVTERQDLLDLVARVRKTSPLQHLCTSGIQDRISETVSHCQEILGMFSNLGFRQHVETAHQTQRQLEAGLLVVVRTKHVDQVGNVMLQAQDSNQASHRMLQQDARAPQGWPKNKHVNTQGEATIVKIVKPRVGIQTLPLPIRESRIQSPLAQTVKAAESEPMMQPPPFSKSNAQAPRPSQNDQLQTPPSQTRISISRIKGQPNTQSDKTPPQPPVMVRSEVHSKAQSMARSRLEKARFRLQGRIQQAIKLFGGKEISASQAKRKQRALKILQPAILEEFLGAVEGFGAFCTGPQLQDLMLLSDSVRKQWEDVLREMAAFVPILWSNIREGKQPFSVVQRETQTNALHNATDQTDHDFLLQQQVIEDGAASVDVESLQELCETLTPRQSSCLATDQLRESDEAQETQPSDTVLPPDCRGQQLRGNTPLRATGVSADTQRSNSLPQKQSVDSQQQDLSPVCVAESVLPRADTLQLRDQDVPTQSEDVPTQCRGQGSESKLKPSLRSKERPLKARLLNITEDNQQTQAHVQAVVRGDTVETKQEAEWTVISETAALQQEEHSSRQEAQERYRKSRSAFQSQLQRNKQHLEEFILDPVTTSTLQNQRKQLQTLKQVTQTLAFEFELQYAQISRCSRLMSREDVGEVERDWERLSQQWRGQLMCLQSRMTCLENTAELMESADDQMALIKGKLDRIIRESVDISSLTLADSRLKSDLKEMDVRLRSEARKLSERGAEVKRQELEAKFPSSLCQALRNTVHHLEQLRQQLEKVQSAAQALDHFLATVREVKAEIPTLLAKQDTSRQRNLTDWEQERHCWQAAMQQRLQTAAQQSDCVDSTLKAVGMTLTMDGAAVTCQDVVTSLSQQAVDVEKEMVRAKRRERKSDDSPHEGEEQEQDHPTLSRMEEESGLEAKRSRLEEHDETNTQGEGDHKAQTWASEGDVLKAKDQRRRISSQVKKEGEEKESLLQRRVALLGTLREIRRAAEQLRLQEPTLPALQHRTRALTELESRLAAHLAELQHMQDAALQSEIPDGSQTREGEDVWKEAKKAVSERLEQCCTLTELLKKFQSIRGELSGTLQRAESTISEQASYLGKDNLQRLHTKVQDTKAELNGLGDGIEEIRNVCRQLHTHLRKIPECTMIPFEDEAEALMDRWLDVSERTDSRLENLHVGLTLWDGVLELGADVESWTTNKVAVFAQSPSFETEDNIRTMQNEIAAQEEKMERFHRRAAEVQALLQSTEPPLELQVVETQMRKKIEQLKELVSEAEDVYRQMVAAKEQITARMSECFNSLQRIQDSLLTLSGLDVATVLAKLKNLLFELQTQDEQAESLLEDLQVMASIASSVSLQSLSADAIQLQDKVRNTHQLFSEVDEETERNIQAHNRLQREGEHLKQWLQSIEERVAKEEDVSLLQEEALQQRARTEALHQLVSSLRRSTLRQCAVVEESSKLLQRYHNFQTSRLHGCTEKQSSLSRESPQSWVGDLRRADDSLSMQSGVEQKLHHAQAAVSATTEKEARLEELRVTGDCLSHKMCDEDNVKLDIQDTTEEAEEQGKDLLQSGQPCHSALQPDPDLTSSYLDGKQQACRKVEELQRRTAQLPTLFPWPGTSERRQTCLVAHQLQDEAESLQLTLTSLAEQRTELAEQTDSTGDPSSAEVDTCLSSLMEEVKGVCSRLEEGVCNEEHFGQSLQDCRHKLTSLQERMSACQAQEESSAGLITDVPALEALLQEVTDIEKDLLQIVTLKDSITASLTAEAQASLSQQVSNLQSHKRALDSSIREHLALLTENRNLRVQQVKEEISCVQTTLKDLAENLSGNCEVSPDTNQLKQQWYTLQDCDTRLTELAARVNDLKKTGELGISQEPLHAEVTLTVEAVAKDLNSITSALLQKKQECAENTANRVRQLISQLQKWSQTVRAEPSSHSQAALNEGLRLQQDLRELLSERDILLYRLGKKVTKKLQKRASAALNESTLALETLSKFLVAQGSQGHCEVELDKDLPGRVVEETCSSESDAPYLASADETTAMCPPASPSAINNKENSSSDQNDNKLETKGPLETDKEDVPKQFSSAADVFKSQLLTSTPPTFNLKKSEPLQEDTTSTQDSKSTIYKDNTKEITSAHCVTPLVGSPGTKPDSTPLSYPESVSEHLAAQSETFKAVTDAHEEHCEDIGVTPKKVYTIMLDIEPQDTQKIESVGPDAPRCSQGAELCDTTLTEVSTIPEKNSGLLNSPESDFQGFLLAADTDISKPLADAPETEKYREDISESSDKVYTIVLDIEPQDTQKNESVGPDALRCSQEAELCDTTLTKVSTIPEKNSGLLTSPESDLESLHLAAQTDTLKALTDAPEKEKYCEDVSESSDKVYSTVLDIEPQDMQKNESVGPDALRCSQAAELCDTTLTEDSTIPEEKSGLLNSPELDFTSLHLAAQTDTSTALTDAPEKEKYCEDISESSDKVYTIVLDIELPDFKPQDSVGASRPDVLSCSQGAELCDTTLTEVSTIPEKNSGLLNSPESDFQSLHLVADTDISKPLADAPETEKYREDISESSDKVYTTVLDIELPDFKPQDSVGASRPDVLSCSQGAELCDAKLTEVSSIPETESGLLTTLASPESDKTGTENHSLKSYALNESQVTHSLPENPSALVTTELDGVKSTSAELSCKEKSETPKLMHSEVLNSSSSCGTVAECQLTGAHTAETTSPDVKQEETTDFCHAAKQTMSSVFCTAEGDAITATQIPAGDNKQMNVADTAQSKGTGQLEVADGEKTEEASDPEHLESKLLKGPKRREKATPLFEESEWKVAASLEDTEVTQKQRQRQESMEPERTAPGLEADLQAWEATGGSTESYKQESTMQDVLSEIQSLVERSNIINRTPHIDLNWYLKSSPGEPEIRLVRTVQKVLACRYQPARLDVTAMAKQLQEAEDYRRCVQEQVATIKSMSSARICDPVALRRVEGQCCAALLDASATAQVKATQLDQVKQYHRQMKITRAFMEVVATEKDKMSLNTLGSSALQADKLHALLQTMVQKKDMIDGLLQLGSQLSVHLSNAESSGALLAQLGDVQEEWRLLEGSIKRALQHASSSTSQSSLLIKEAELLKAKLEALQKSDFQSHNSKSALEYVCLTTDLKLYNQLYLHLQSQSDALVHFSLGQKEKDEIRRNLKELGSLLNVTKGKFDTSTFSCGSISSAKINKQLQDLIIWAKQAENHISIGKKLALFPEEARFQITEMKKFQNDIWFRRSKMQEEVEHMKDVVSDMEKEESDHVLKTVEDLYEAIADSLDHVLDTMKKNLQEREKLLCQLASMDAWLAETHAERDPCTHVDNVSKANIRKLESKLKSHKSATVEIEIQLKQVEAMGEICKEIAVGLSPGESRYLVNRLSGLWTELDGLLAHEKAASWELEELIHERTTSDEELATIQASLKQISTDVEQQRFPLTQETLSTIAHLKHMLMEHQCQAQELEHCQEAKRSSLLSTIGELQDQCKALTINATEQDKYLHLRRQMEESRDITKEQIQRAKDKTISVVERFRLCQILLVELPLLKTQCQEAADQLEAVAQELYPSELNAERQRIHHTVETLVSWEFSVTDDIKKLEAKLLRGLQFSSELPNLKELFLTTRAELAEAEPVNPDERAIDTALRRNWVIWRNMESGMRVLEGLARKEKVNLKNYKDLYSLRDATMQECHLRMESLCQARESLKDYQWAAQGAIGFLHNAESTFLSATGGFLDCTEEKRQTQQALEALEDGFQAHISHLADLVPQQPCLSCPKQLHISILSQLLVGRAILEAQAQLRLESLQRCEISGPSHRKCHEDIRQRLSGLETKLSDCAAVQVTSYDKCVAQQKRAKLLMEDLRSLAGKIEELRAGCPMQGCGVGKGGELGAFWRRWVSLRRGVGLLMAHTEQRGEEWKDITTSMEQCCSLLASLQAEVPDSATVSFTQEEPLELLAQAEIHQAGLEQEQQALASLEHRLEHALSLSRSQEPISPGPVGKTLVKIQENVRSLKERNLLVVAAAQAEEKERQQVQEEIEELERHMFDLLPALEACSNPIKQQELRKDLSSQKAKLKRIVDGVQSRYTEIPADISRRLQEVELSLQTEEEKLMEKSDPVRKLARQVAELGSGLDKVTELLEQNSATVSDAQNALKHAWDELDAWHSRLMLLESEVQDLAEEHPDQAHQLMDQLTHPLQLYQNAAQMTEQRTAFLSKIPECLQEFEDILYGATCWLDEAQSWLGAPCCFTTARGLQNHANSLQLVLDDSERIRQALEDFRPVLDEISDVCDISTHKERVDQNDQQVDKMQRQILEPLEQLLQAVSVVEAMEAELKTMEKNVPKIKAILSSVDDSNISVSEHLHNRQVILANVQSMRRTLEEVERCKGELHLPKGADESLLVFSRARLLLQPLEELEQLTQQQATLLENKIREEEQTRKDLGITALSDIPEEAQQHDRSALRHLVQEAIEVTISEEEEDEENESCHSSSSDTLTCSIPEDLEETLNASDVQSEDLTEIKPLSDVKALETLTGQFSSEEETSSKSADTGLLFTVPGLHSKEFASENVETGLITMDSKAGKALSPKTETTKSLVAAAVPAAEFKFTAAAIRDTYGSPQHETRIANPHAESPQAAAAVEDTRVIPTRPITPFSATRGSREFIEEGSKHLPLSVPSHQDLDTLNVLKEQSEVTTSQSRLFEESQQAQESSEVPKSSAIYEEDEQERLRWSRLYTQISQKLTTLKKVKEEHQIGSGDGGSHDEDPQRELASTGSASAVLQRTHESITKLKQIVSSPGENKELYEAARKVLLCLDALTDLVLTSGEDDPQLRLLQQECVSTELVTLAELLSKVESETKPALSGEKPQALRCLSSLQECLQTVRPVLTSSHSQLNEHLGNTHQHQELSSSQLCILDEFEPEHSEIFPSIKDAPRLEQCVLGRHLRESPGEKAKLQQASWSLLQGITGLLELGEECLTKGQKSQVHNRSQLQAVLCRREKLLRVLRSQLAFVQHLFQHEPEALKCQEDERVQLEVRAKALQQRALEQEVASQRSIQEWTQWEDNCGGLGRLLDDVEAFISSGEPEGDDEKLAQHRQDACQQTLVQLDESRAALGLLLDQGKVLQTEPEFAATVSQAGGALELRWQSAYRRTKQESKRCRDIQDRCTRFQADFASVSKWLVDANKHQKTWSDLTQTSDLSQECIHSNLIELLDFSIETEAMSVQKAAASREAAQLLHLREADCPGLRAQLAQLDVNWTQLTSDLSKTQDRLQQRLLAAWPPGKLLSNLEGWLKTLEARLSQEKETVLKAKDAAQITEVLQHYQELKAGVVNGQLLLDFLCQSGPQVVGADIQALRSERTMFAEELGALRLQWQHLQRELESQTREAEQMHHTCADREKRLQHLHDWIKQQKKQLDQCKQPTSQTLARKALQEWEAVVGRVKEVDAALQELKATRVHVGQEEDHPCDISFSGRTESVCHACGNLSQQMDALRPALQQTLEQWSCFERDLKEVSLHTTRVCCALQHQPLFSLKQAEGHLDLLQQLQEKAEKGEELLVNVDKSYQSLVKTLHPGTVQILEDQMRGERKRWTDLVQELKDEHTKTGETLSLWQEYARLSDQCSLHLQTLWHQWEELPRSSPQQDAQAMLHSVEKLQDAAEDLQSSVGDVLAASKPLVGRLEPPAANIVQSETRMLSRDVLLLSQAVSGKKKSVQEDVEQQKLFHTRLEALEKQTQDTQQKLKASLSDTDSVKQVLLELSEMFPSLVDVRETSAYVAINNREAERLHMLSRQWVQSMMRASDTNRALEAERQRSQNFQEKCKNLTSIQKKLEEELMSKKPQSLSSLQEMLSVHQRLEADIITGHQLLQGLLCQAVESMETATGEKRSELMAQVISMRESWFNSVALASQRRSLTKEQLGQWRVYHRGSKLLWKLLRVVDPLLPPAGPALCALQQLQSCLDDNQCVEDALGQHTAVYTQTLEAGRHLCETMTESECQSRLQSELQAIQEAWERSAPLLERRRDLVKTTVQKWSQCQDGITRIMSELDEVKNKLEQPLPERLQDSESETHIQETDLSLQRVASGFKELATMKTDLSQYVAAGDSALLEQQLEQLHAQWEELCMKVSLRRQEIADRLNAWTIFNDKNKEFCDWLTQMENKVCHSGDLSIEEMVEKLKKDCMEEINLFSENKSHLKQLGEQLLLASDEAKQMQVHGSLQEVNQRWHNLFHDIEARVKKLKETLVAVQQLDKNMSNLRSWLSRIEAELSRPITYSVCHHQEIQRRLAEQQELQRDIEQHTEGVASVLSLCDVLLRDEDAAGGTEVESDSLQETSRSLDQRWRAICAMALDRRLRIEETWRLWCKFLDDYSRFEDWLKMAEHTAANPNSADVLYTVAKEELKKFEGFQRQVHERLTQLELVNNQYRRLARENRTDRASQLKAMVHEGNRRWDTLHRRVAAILRRLKYFTSQREEFEGTRESMLVWLTELDLQLTNVEHFSESDVHHKIQQLNSFQKEITLNTERIDGLIVFGEGLIQKSSPQDAALIEDELEELHSYCQEVFGRLVRFHQRLSQPSAIKEEPELSATALSLESSLELIGRPWLGRTQGSLPATPIHLLASPLEGSGRETPVSVDSLPLEWDHTGDVGGSSSHEDDEEEEDEHEDDRTYFSALSVSSRSLAVHDSPRWQSQGDPETQSLQLDSEGHTQAPPTLTSTPLKQGYLRLMSQCSSSIKDIKRVSLILDDEEQPEELGLTGLTASDQQSGVIERWELLQAQSRSDQHPQEPRQLTSDLDEITSWLGNTIPELERLQQSDPAASIEDMAARAVAVKEMQKKFTHYKSIMLSANLRAQEAPELQERLAGMNRDWSRACTGLQQWDTSLRKTLMRCQEFHETLHSLLLWLAHGESRLYAVDISDPDTPVQALRQHHSTLTDLQEELQGRQTQQASLQALWSQLQPEDEAEESIEAQEKLHVTGGKLKSLLRRVDQDLGTLQQRLDCESASEAQGQSASAEPKNSSSSQRQRRELSPPRSFFYRVLRAAFPLQLLLLFLLLLPCLIPLSDSEPGCAATNNYAWSFYPTLHYTNGPPPT
ncbi:nesprin-2a isoform X4 [Epinephelus lanceolatus]